LTTASTPIALAVQSGPIAVIHRRGVDTVFVVLIAAAVAATMATLLATLIGRTSSPTAPASPSSSSGGMIWTCVHNSLSGSRVFRLSEG
jgi:hypothetical protein